MAAGDCGMNILAGFLYLIFAKIAIVGATSSFVCPQYIYAFGDSLTDTGNAQAESLLMELTTRYPYGESYRFPDRPCERTRFCDGRIIVDFTAQAFGFPFLEPYSRHFESTAYSCGVNFAYAGGTADSVPVQVPPFFLGREVDNYFKFRSNQTGINVKTAMHLISEIGGNDFTFAFRTGFPPGLVNAQLNKLVIGAIESNLENLYAGGARFFYLFNNPAAGCTPAYLTEFSENSPKDQYGCLSAYNDAIQNFNEEFKYAIDVYRTKRPDTTILFFDWFAATIEVIANSDKYGIELEGMKACCGSGGSYNYDPLLRCGSLSSASNVCSDPQHRLWWDHTHFTEAFYRIMATFLLSGQFVDGPPEAVNLKATCYLDFSLFPVLVPNPPTCQTHDSLHKIGGEEMTSF